MKEKQSPSENWNSMMDDLHGESSNGWLTEKPDFKNDCLVITATKIADEYEYTLFVIKEIANYDGYTYMAWLTGDGDEYGNLADLHAEKYLVLPLLK